MCFHATAHVRLRHERVPFPVHFQGFPLGLIRSPLSFERAFAFLSIGNRTSHRLGTSSLSNPGSSSTKVDGSRQNRRHSCSFATKMAKMENVLVTGVAGFVGSHFARRILHASSVKTVVGVDKMSTTSSWNNLQELQRQERFVFVQGNVLSEGFVGLLCEAYEVDTVVHFAAQTVCDEDLAHSPDFTLNNVLGTHVILESLRMYGKIERYLYISTDEVHGKSIKMCEAQEEEQLLLEPPNPYSAAKVGAELMSKVYALAYGLPVIVVRLTNVYGPCEFPFRAIPKFIMLALSGKPLPVHGDGSATRSFIYIDDVVDGLCTILKKGSTQETYVLGPSCQKKMVDVANDVLAIVGDTSQEATAIFVDRRPFVEERYFVLDEKLRSLGWEEKVTWLEGLKKTIYWYRHHGATWWNMQPERSSTSALLGLHAAIKRSKD